MDRSWYNRAGVERVMGFCTEDEYQEFLRACPEFERMLLRSGVILVKYWFSVSDAEQERRFQRRLADPTHRWKLSPMDLKSREMWVEYSRAKDDMFHYTDTKQSPWWVVGADDKRRARLNCISHLLEQISYGDLTPEPIKLPPRRDDSGYVRPHDRPDLRPRPLPLSGRPMASIAVGASVKERLAAYLRDRGYQIEDYGNGGALDVAAEVAEAVARGEHDRPCWSAAPASAWPSPPTRSPGSEAGN
jgi:hypothetical protein